MDKGSGGTAIVIAALGVLAALVTVSPQLIKALRKWRDSGRPPIAVVAQPAGGSEPVGTGGVDARPIVPGESARPAPPDAAHAAAPPQTWAGVIPPAPPLPRPRTAADAWIAERDPRPDNNWPGTAPAPSPMPPPRTQGEHSWLSAQTWAETPRAPGGQP
jgi:hypothetical protein